VVNDFGFIILQIKLICYGLTTKTKSKELNLSVNKKLSVNEDEDRSNN